MAALWHRQRLFRETHAWTACWTPLRPAPTRWVSTGPHRPDCPWIGERKLLLVGSAWDGEWKRCAHWNNGRRTGAFLVAPHEVKGPAVDQWCSASGFPFSDHAQRALPASAGLILDRVGCLKHAYRLADLAVVGGGWGAGVHNTLEPAALACPSPWAGHRRGFREIAGLGRRRPDRVCH